jgi:hypothetical protein
VVQVQVRQYSLCYTVTINNVGSGASTGIVSESFSIPTGLTFNSGGGSGWTCAPTGPVAGQRR